MFVQTLEIIWHTKKPVFSVDFHESGRVATGGADNEVRIWQVTTTEDKPAVEFLASLLRHSGSVNCVRFSPTGDYLASAGDDGIICIWNRVPDQAPQQRMDAEWTDKECWRSYKQLRSNRDIMDLQWSMDGCEIVAASIDNKVVVWDVVKKVARQELQDHSHYVLGIGLDPMGEWLASQSADRTMCVYRIAKRGKGKSYKKQNVVSHLSLEGASEPERKAAALEPAEHAAAAVVTPLSPAPTAEPAKPEESGTLKSGSKKYRMFVDENVVSFFRRLSWSPDGALLVAPMGLYVGAEGKAPQHVCWVFARNNLKTPVACLPGPEKAVVCVRFCPMLFALREPKPGFGAPMVSLKYRMVFAVGTMDAVLVYDTQQQHPIVLVTNLHCSTITDLSWSKDGRTLGVASNDGYVSFVAFAEGELGQPIPREEWPEAMKPKPPPAEADSAPVVEENASVAAAAVPAVAEDATTAATTDAKPVPMEEVASAAVAPAAPAEGVENVPPAVAANVPNVVVNSPKPSGEKRPADGPSADAPPAKKRRVAPTLIST